jgi:hypothetical protein
MRCPMVLFGSVEWHLFVAPLLPVAKAVTFADVSVTPAVPLLLVTPAVGDIDISAVPAGQ